MVVDEHWFIQSLIFLKSVQSVTRQACNCRTPFLLLGSSFKVPIRWMRVYTYASDHSLSQTGGTKRHLIHHYCSAAMVKELVAKPLKEQNQTPIHKPKISNPHSTTRQQFLIFEQVKRIWFLVRILIWNLMIVEHLNRYTLNYHYYTLFPQKSKLV